MRLVVLVDPWPVVLGLPVLDCRVPVPPRLVPVGRDDCRVCGPLQHRAANNPARARGIEKKRGACGFIVCWLAGRSGALRGAPRASGRASGVARPRRLVGSWRGGAPECAFAWCRTEQGPAPAGSTGWAQLCAAEHGRD